MRTSMLKDVKAVILNNRKNPLYKFTTNHDCEACGDLGRVNNIRFDDVPCPCCRGIVAHLWYRVKLVLWNLGIITDWNRWFRGIKS